MRKFARIGLAAARELAELGCSVTLFARNEERLAEACKSLSVSSGQQHQILVADFSDVENVSSAIDQWLERNRSCHILVNNTGGPPGGSAIDAEIPEFLAAFHQHVVVNQTLVQKLVPGMKSEEYGRIINVISTSVKQPINGLGVSNTVRGAVANWSKTLANELGPFAITVNNVLPGATSTARLDAIVYNVSKRQSKSREEVENGMLAAIPARRFGEPEEIGQAIAFLASPAAGYINGINLPVDGGRTQCL
ncbi:MAG: SDR family oxidoreductase [Pirellulaceae bacterium]